MARLRSARLTDATLVSQIDDYVAELESDVATIFGFTLDADITESPFSCDNSGRLTKQLIRFKRAAALTDDTAPGTIGLQITNSTNSSVANVGVSGIETEQDEVNLGVSPAFHFGTFASAGTVYDRDESFNGFALLLGTGSDLLPYDFILGRIFSSTSQGLTPRGSGNAGEYLCSDGVFRTPGQPVEFVSLYDATLDGVENTTFQEGLVEPLWWKTEASDVAGMHTALQMNVTIPTTGNYLASAFVRISPETLEPNSSITVKIIRDRAAAQTTWAEIDAFFDVSPDDFHAVNADAVIPCNSGDTLFVTVYYNNGSLGGYYTIPAGVSGSGFSVKRI